MLHVRLPLALAIVTAIAILGLGAPRPALAQAIPPQEEVDPDVETAPAAAVAAPAAAPVVAAPSVPAAPTAAQSATFTVSGVKVDVTAANTVAARDQAFAEAPRAAFRQLIERLANEPAKVTDPGRDGLQNLVRDVAVEQEKSTSVRYIATLTVRFKPEAVRHLLQAAGVPYAEGRDRPFVVLPVWQPAGGPAQLWEDGNPWRAVWAGRKPDGLVQLVVPLGEIDDITSIDAAAALAVNPEKLTVLAERNGARDVLVATAAVAGTPPQVTVKIAGFGPFAKRLGTTLTVTGTAQDTLAGLLAKAAIAVNDAVQQGYKHDNTLQFDQRNTMAAVVKLTGLDDWLKVRDRLKSVAMVRQTEVVSLSRGEAALILHFIGDQGQLEMVLAQNGLELSGGDPYWIIRPTGGTAATAAMPR